MTMNDHEWFINKYFLFYNVFFYVPFYIIIHNIQIPVKKYTFVGLFYVAVSLAL